MTSAIKKILPYGKLQVAISIRSQGESKSLIAHSVLDSLEVHFCHFCQKFLSCSFNKKKKVKWWSWKKIQILGESDSCHKKIFETRDFQEGLLLQLLYTSGPLLSFLEVKISERLHESPVCCGANVNLILGFNACVCVVQPVISEQNNLVLEFFSLHSSYAKHQWLKYGQEM